MSTTRSSTGAARRQILLLSAVPFITTGLLWGGGVNAAVRPIRTAAPPAQAIPVTTGTVTASPSLSKIPVVVVPTTFGGPKPLWPAPAQVTADAWVAIPSATAAQLADYLVPLDRGTGEEWISLLGPRSLTGSALDAGDGSVAVTLTHGSLTLSLSLENNNPMGAQTLNELFPAAGKLTNETVPGSWPRRDLLHPATIVYQDHDQRAFFAYQVKDGEDVYGIGQYMPTSHTGWAAAKLTFMAPPTQTDLAPWVIHRGLTIFRSTVAGVTPPQAAIPIVPGTIPSYHGYSEIPTVILPARYPTAGPHPTPKVPTEESVAIPPAIAEHLADYVIPTGYHDTFWIVLGPRGMTGIVNLGDDGTDGWTLTNSTATLSWFIGNPSVPLAAAHDSNLFPAAGQFLNAEGTHLPRQALWHTRELLHPATTLYRHHGHLALFAYQNLQEQSVHGIGIWRPSGRYPHASITVQYTAHGTAATWAPWIVRQALAVINDSLSAQY